MHASEIMQQLEKGAIDVDDALALFDTPAASPMAASSEERRMPVARNRRGQVVLASVALPPARFPSVIARPSMVLTPLSPVSASAVSASAVSASAISASAVSAGAISASPVAAGQASSVVVPSAKGVVRLSYPASGVAVVALEDRAQRNMFSETLVSELTLAFADLSRREGLRVVVIHGHATWFCSGGTPSTLDDIRSGAVAFTDTKVFRLLLDCEVPTIAAMQGHALGGGMTFGLYADILLFAEQAYYAGNFMAHGFTPGVGATYLFPHKLGHVLGSEMLLTARRYQGSELRDRGVQGEVLPSDQVLPRALEIAKELAHKPVAQLKLLKRRLAQGVKRGVAEAIDEELMMHRIIFRSATWSPE